MKYIRKIMGIFFALGPSFKGHSALLDPQVLMQKAPVTVEKAGENLDKFSENVHDKIVALFSFFKDFINDPLSDLGSRTSFDFLIHYKNFHFLKLLIVLAGSWGAFVLLRRTTSHLWKPVPSSRPHKSIDAGDRIFFYLLPWFVLLLTGAVLAYALDLASLLTLMINTSLFILATGSPLLKISSLTQGKPTRSSPLSASFLKKWLPYLIILGGISIVFIVFFSFLCPLLVDLTSADRPHTFTVNSPAFFFWTKTFFYFYLINLAIFLLHLQYHVEQKAPSKKIWGSKNWAEWWKAYGIYWYGLCDVLLVLCFCSWIAVSLGLLSVVKGQTFFVITTFLVIITLNDITQRVISYIARKTSHRIFSQRVETLFSTVSFTSGFFYLLYYFGLFLLGAYIWDNPSFYRATLAMLQTGGEKAMVVGGIIALTLFFQHRIQATMQRVIDSRTPYDTSARSWSRVYTLFELFKEMVSFLLWLPALIIILNYAGLEGRYILFGCAGLLGAFVWVGQGAVQDMIRGLSYVLGNVVVLDEAVYINGIIGVIERVGLSSLSIRDPEGFVHTFSYSRIDSIVCMEWKFANLLAQVTITYDSDQQLALRLMKEVFDGMIKDKAFHPFIQDPVIRLCVRKIGDNGIMLEGVAKVVPSKRDALKTEYLLRVKNIFDKHKVKLAGPHTNYFKKP